MSPRILHLIPELGLGGADRSALTVAALGAGQGQQHRIASLLPANRSSIADAAARGIDVLDAPAPAALEDAIAEADLVQLHFWNSPELCEVLERELPPMRLLLWPHVAGNVPPQIVLPEVAAAADLAIATSELSANALGAFSDEKEPVAIIPPVGGWERVENVRRSDRVGFNIGYLGTVGFIKLDPGFAGACADIDVPDARFIVCGAGDAVRSLPLQAAELGLARRFELLGQRREIAPVLADLDVFGFPLRQGSTGSSDLVLKEAMYAGVPPVVLPRGGADLLVDDGRTGMVVSDLDAYARAIERLHADPAERDRLGAAARAEAARRWSPEVVWPKWMEAYERILAQPKRGRPAVLSAPEARTHPGAARFVRGLGKDGERLEASIEGSGQVAATADEWIADCSPVIGLGGGGLLDYRRRYSDDALLSLWGGLFLHRQGRPALAAGLLAEARKLGCPPGRLEPRLRELVEA